MNQEAPRIGLAGSHFANSTGLPDPEQYMTARDLATLARYIIEQFPKEYKIYGERQFTWNKIKQPNRNPLLDMNIGRAEDRLYRRGTAWSAPSCAMDSD